MSYGVKCGGVSLQMMRDNLPIRQVVLEAQLGSLLVNNSHIM